MEIHTAEQLAYLNDDCANIAAHTPAVANTERSHPMEAALGWRVSGEPLPAGVIYQLSLGMLPDLEDAVVYETAKTGFSVCNLRIDGVTNCRDVGGWKTADGNTVKQGMLYRTARLETITEDGTKTLLEELGTRTEIDLRGGSPRITFEGVNTLTYTCGSNATLIDMKAALPEIFRVLADKGNYPIVYHCQIGTDRTGTLTFLINALLGVAEEDLFYDYCFSNFGAICNPDATSFTVRDPQYLQGNIYLQLQRTSGKTMQEKVRNYLLSIGISEATLNAVTRLMLESA